jgi:hypothetical protein
MVTFMGAHSSEDPIPAHYSFQTYPNKLRPFDENTEPYQKEIRIEVDYSCGRPGWAWPFWGCATIKPSEHDAKETITDIKHEQMQYFIDNRKEDFELIKKLGLFAKSEFPDLSVRVDYFDVGRKKVSDQAKSSKYIEITAYSDGYDRFRFTDPFFSVLFSVFFGNTPDLSFTSNEVDLNKVDVQDALKNIRDCIKSSGEGSAEDSAKMHAKRVCVDAYYKKVGMPCQMIENNRSK